MLVGAELKKVAMAGGDVAMANSRKRGATKGLTWPNGVIPYVIDSSLNGKEEDPYTTLYRHNQLCFNCCNNAVKVAERTL